MWMSPIMSSVSLLQRNRDAYITTVLYATYEVIIG